MRFGSCVALCLLGGLVAVSPSWALENRPAPPAGDSPQGGVGTILAGTMNVQVVNGCYALVSGTVDTPSGGGTAHAGITYWDDGNFEGGDPLDFPANGTTQTYCLVHQQLLPVLQGAPGLGIYLMENETQTATTTFASSPNTDISDVCTGPAPQCGASVVDVPTVSQGGLAMLVLALASAAVVLLMRRRGSTT